MASHWFRRRTAIAAPTVLSPIPRCMIPIHFRIPKSPNLLPYHVSPTQGSSTFNELGVHFTGRVGGHGRAKVGGAERRERHIETGKRSGFPVDTTLVAREDRREVAWLPY